MKDVESTSKLNQYFTQIKEYLDKMDNLREEILPMQRSAVRISSEIIKKIHRKQLDTIPTQIDEVKSILQKIKSLIQGAPGNFAADYLSIVQQEFGEAALFYHLIVNQIYASPEELGIDFVEYAYACADLIGELRRYALDALRNEDLELALNTLEKMDTIHGELFSMDYPKGLVPGLRPKIDQARNILARTESDIAVSANILKLNRNLSKLNLKSSIKLDSFGDESESNQNLNSE
jgi:translin